MEDSGRTEGDEEGKGEGGSREVEVGRGGRKREVK